MYISFASVEPRLLVWPIQHLCTCIMAYGLMGVACQLKGWLIPKGCVRFQICMSRHFCYFWGSTTGGWRRPLSFG